MLKTLRAATITLVFILLLSNTAPFAQAPEIVATIPLQNELNVSPNTHISVTFNIDIDESTVNDSTFTVNSKFTGSYIGAITYDSPARTATFVPSDDFFAGDIITAVLTKGIESAFGGPMDSSYIWSFTISVDSSLGVFAPHSAYSVDEAPWSIFGGDFDGDGDIDLTTTNPNNDNISVILNNGDGTFGTHSVYTVGDEPFSVFAADLDGDGNIDLITANVYSNNVSVLLNNGDGTFAAHTTYATGIAPGSVIAADLDGDGDLDLVTANRASSNVSILLNDGDGTFSPHEPYAVGTTPRSVYASDLDNDGDLDLTTANAGSVDVSVLLNNNDGTFATHSVYPVGSDPWSIIAADLDGDSYLDLITGNGNSNNVSVLRNNGDGTFAPYSTYPVGDRPLAVVTADFEGDGDIDIATSNLLSHSVTILFNNGDGTFGPNISYPVGNHPTSIFAADFDNDGDMDLATANASSGNVSVLSNDLSFVISPPTLSFTALSGGWNPPGQTISIESNSYPLNFVITDDADWLSVSDSSGTTPATTTVSVNIEGLLTGDYIGLLTLVSDDPEASLTTVIVNLTITNWPPSYCIAAHRRGKISLSVNNNGTIGIGFASGPTLDCFTGEPVPSCEYPINSNVEYLFAGAIWIGAVVGDDTLVSEGADGWSRPGNELNPFADMIYRTTLDSDDPEAISEEDYVAVYTDTSTEGVSPDFFGRPHIPLNIEVTQSSYAWSYPYTEDFILFDYNIMNTGFEVLDNVYIGFYVDADVGHAGLTGPPIHTDDITGFLETAPVYYGSCQFVDTVNIAWIADNDGDPIGGYFSPESAPHVTATSILHTPSESVNFSFNWWVSHSSPALDFGPRERSGMGAWPEEFRDFGTGGGLGTPEGDVNKYYIMRNQEFDYDQAYTAIIQPSDTLWMTPPPDLAPDFADGYDTRYLLSFGPFIVNPGQSLSFTKTYVAGENLHTITNNLINLPYNPDQFYENLDFSDLTLNVRWASWIYDNPGVDTDSDGYFGKIVVCENDTFWVEGDGVPDYRAASPPQAPTFWLAPLPASIWIRWNGLLSETGEDIVSHLQDFEGYHAYLSQDGSPGSYTLVASYDIDNYLKYIWNTAIADWEIRDMPFTLEELRCLYGDSCDDSGFHPLDYTSNNPYIHPLFPDSIFYFEAFGNNPELGITTPIQKIYPNQPYPSSLNPDSALPGELTDDGYFKYFEYEMTMENLLPNECYFVNVTAFDFGYPPSGVPPMESSRTQGAQEACTEALPPITLIDPDPMYMLHANTIDTFYAQVLTEEFPSGYTASDVDLTSLYINDSILPTSSYIHPAHPLFPDEVLEINFPIRDFILGYGFLYDTTIQTYTVSGEFTDATPFIIESEFTLIGHISGDVNADGVVDISDLVYLVAYFFNGVPAPQPIEAADVDQNGQVNIGDLVSLVEYMF